MFDPVDVIKSLVRCPSVSTDPAYADGMEATREVLIELFQSMGLAVETLSTPKHPVILAERHGPDEWPHVIIYGHYDVQPPDPLDLWDSPAFEPTFKGSRLYGRGVADNKAPMMVHITAAARLLEANPNLPLRITFLIEGEEEIGSPSLPFILEQYADRLRGDFILLSDTLNPSDDQVAITTGIRGMVTCEIEVTGPRRDLHSGMYGGAVLNPIQALAHLCASLHDANGRVNIPGFYDAVIEPAQWEQDELDKLQISDAEYCDAIGIPATHTPNGRTPLEAVRYEPTVEFNGIGGGYQGEGDKTIIPSRAFAKISCRLVANQTPEDIRARLFNTLRDRCPNSVRLNIREGHHGPTYSVTPPGRSNTPPNQNPHLARAFEAMDSAIMEVFGQPPLYLREGGSIPIIGVMHQTLGMDCIMLGMGTAENNLHSPNESFNMDILEKGIAVSMRVLETVAMGS
jgi:acetylornithine deacetylase/succinyl-diaminopimelate desuccinylase-like protein